MMEYLKLIATSFQIFLLRKDEFPQFTERYPSIKISVRLFWDILYLFVLYGYSIYMECFQLDISETLRCTLGYY